MIQAANICLAGFIKILFLGVKILGDAVKIVRLDLTLHNICSSFLSRACWLLLTYILAYLLGLEGMVSSIFLLCFIWGIYKSFINYKNLDEFITRFIANRLNNIIDIIIFNTLIFIVLFIIYYFWEISSFNFLAFWLYMNMPSGEMPSWEGSGTSSGGGSASGGMQPGNNQGGPLPPGHDPGNHQGIMATNHDENNNQNYQQQQPLPINRMDGSLETNQVDVLTDLWDYLDKQNRAVGKKKNSTVVRLLAENGITRSSSDYARVYNVIQHLAGVMMVKRPNEWSRWSVVNNRPMQMTLNAHNLQDLRGLLDK